MNVAALEKSLKSGGPKAVYLIQGPEAFFRREALSLIRKAVTGDGDAADIRELEAEKLDPRDLLDDLRTPGLFAARRLIIVENADLLLRDTGDLLLRYAERPATNATLVLVATRLDARRKAVKVIMQKAVAVECPAMRQRELMSWCINRARRLGKRLRPDAARLLLDLAGRNLGQLDGQIGSLAAYCDRRAEITAEDVSNLVGGDHARDVWEIVRATTARSPTAALRALHRLRREPRSSPTAVIGSLGREVRDMWIVKRLLDAGWPKTEVQDRVLKPDWVFAAIVRTVKGVKEAELRVNHRRVLNADVECKTTSRTNWWVVERLVLELCGVEQFR